MELLVADYPHRATRPKAWQKRQDGVKRAYSDTGIVDNFWRETLQRCPTTYELPDTSYCCRTPASSLSSTLFIAYLIHTRTTTALLCFCCCSICRRWNLQENNPLARVAVIPGMLLLLYVRSATCLYHSSSIHGSRYIISLLLLCCTVTRINVFLRLVIHMYVWPQSLDLHV